MNMIISEKKNKSLFLKFYKLIIFLFTISILCFSFFIILDNSNFKVSFENLETTVHYIESFFPLDHSISLIFEILKNILITISIATISVFFSLCFAFPISIIRSQISFDFFYTSKKKKTYKNTISFLVTLNLIFMRSLPELVLALIFVRIFGLGPTAGIFAIIFSYIGFMSKVFTEIIDSTDPSIAESLIKNGSNKVKAILFGTLPQCLDELITYTLFRWECAIRTSIVLGIVGAGGLGQQLEFAIKMMSLNEVSSIILAMIILVYLTDIFSQWTRKVFCK